MYLIWIIFLCLNYFLLEDKVTLPYLLFKRLVSFYLLATCIVSHIDQAIYSESYGIQQNNVGQRDCNNLDHPFNTVDEENCTTSTSLRTRWEWPYYWIYFTNWNWTLICLSFWFDTTFVALRYRKEKRQLHRVAGESKITSTVKGKKSKDTNI